MNLLFYLMIFVEKMPMAVNLETQASTWRKQENHGKKKEADHMFFLTFLYFSVAETELKELTVRSRKQLTRNN